MGSGRGWMAGDWLSTRGRSQHYCGGLDCGLPRVEFWQHNANANYAWLISFNKQRH